MKRVKKWVCKTHPTQHIFDGPSEDGFCPLDPYGHGLLFETFIDVEDAGDPENTASDKSGGNARPRQEERTTHRQPAHSQAPYEKEIGLCVLLMDASSSMTDPAFAGNPLTRMHLAASSAATGIFDLERMQNNPNAYVAAFKFDDRVERMFVEPVASLIDRFDGNVRKFAGYIYEELFKMQQGTDINKALDVAHSFIDKFLRKQSLDFGGKDYTPMQQVIIKGRSAASVTIPNVRVLIYTDGMQFDTRGEKQLRPNPFVRNVLPGLNHDIVIGAFFGQERDEGCRELKSLLSPCPIHEVPQFFLFDSPDKISYLKTLFRMASGASGFCPMCLERELRR